MRVSLGHFVFMYIRPAAEGYSYTVINEMRKRNKMYPKKDSHKLRYFTQTQLYNVKDITVKYIQLN